MTALKKALEFVESKNLEIEIRYGTIIDIFTQERLNIGAQNLVIVTPNTTRTKFISGVTNVQFENIRRKFGSYDYQSVIDRIIVHKNGRYTYVDGKIKSCIKKQKKKTIDIHNPFSGFDMRISFSIENEIPMVPIKDKISVVERNRNRESVIFDKYSLDFTVVDCRGKLTYEIELEVVDLKFDKDEFINFMFYIIE